MNIREAKEQIEHAVKLYLEKDEKGRYIIPTEKQRPVFLMGAPGIGKTAIMEQVAQELGVALVSYTMTHHTRQSALGLPYIVEKEYGGEKFQVSEYTMSEIIAAVYEVMEDTGICEGILFLDEINCVSETLAPAMLQFLQYKTFGQHKVPEGWIIVTAGNPPEYNHSVREFDIASWDRVKRMDVEPDYSVWKTYAYEQGMHPAILTYLDLKKDAFYSVENTVDGKHFVTARGWEDLSSLMYVYEKSHIAITQEVIDEYIHHPDIAEDVYAYLEIYKKYHDDYGIADILDGKVKKTVYQRIFDAGFDECVTVINLILDGLTIIFSDLSKVRKEVQLWYEFLKQYKCLENTSYEDMVKAFEEESDKLKENRLILQEDYYIRQDVLKDIKKPFDDSMDDFTLRSEELSVLEDEAGEKLNHAFDFIEEVFKDGQEMLIFVTELTITPEISSFLAENECEKYDIYNEKLMVGSGRAKLLKELER